MTSTEAAILPHRDLAPLRSDVYALLASLMAEPPSEKRLRQLAKLSVEAGIPAPLEGALIDLGAAARETAAAAAALEYAGLFVGLGRGELVPYASWYLDHLLMAAPLARLRTDLAALDICRREEASEPEDHAAALCEIMVLIVARPDISLEEQSRFFYSHLAAWMVRFFRDLQQARGAAFYRPVGRVGEHFMLLEKQLLQPQPVEEV